MPTPVKPKPVKVSPTPIKRKAEELQDTTIYFDQKGDLRFMVGAEERVFVVCSRTVSRASVVFERMLYGPFAEKKPDDTDSDWVVKLPEDSSKGLEVIFNVVHARFKLVTDFLGLDDLFDVMVMADKYDTMEPIQPWCRRWAENAKRIYSCGTERGQELMILWTAWKLGSSALYEQAAVRLLPRISRPPSTSRSPTTVDIKSYLVGEQRMSEMDGFKYAGSASIIQPVLRVREIVLQRMIDAVNLGKRELMNEKKTSPCQVRYQENGPKNKRQACKTMLAGSICLNQAAWSKVPTFAKDVCHSVESFQHEIDSVLDTLMTLTGHNRCSPKEMIVDDVKKASVLETTSIFIDRKLYRCLVSLS
ncbi:hypothetical protein MGG_08044 [Pyricularia oryzae 70-15]|uniref:BTB domain-containing protein n=1 Tax=Pyricularia oryzae (strain 70-15 / ATCC MYA-4617 / FGSC 8958) TaxID=242507 RepID=G4MXQ2_PYRO7|nr:uncharacterized protein MGG_08044 [Pyricularia oryzae 70-15]EHA55189.1 hypothetical protein MGG_08044 [Pyricularia oryzae 70-15]